MFRGEKLPQLPNGFRPLIGVRTAFITRDTSEYVLLGPLQGLNPHNILDILEDGELRKTRIFWDLKKETITWGQHFKLTQLESKSLLGSWHAMKHQYNDGSGNRRYDLTSLGVSWGSEPTLALHCYSTIAVALWQRHWKSLLSWRWKTKTGRGCPTFWSSLYCGIFSREIGVSTVFKLFQKTSPDVNSAVSSMDFSQTTPTFQEIRPNKFEQVIEIQGYPQCHPCRKYSLNKALLGHPLTFAMKETPGKKFNSPPCVTPRPKPVSSWKPSAKPYGNPMNRWKVNYQPQLVSLPDFWTMNSNLAKL